MSHCKKEIDSHKLKLFHVMGSINMPVSIDKILYNGFSNNICFKIPKFNFFIKAISKNKDSALVEYEFGNANKSLDTMRMLFYVYCKEAIYTFYRIEDVLPEKLTGEDIAKALKKFHLEPKISDLSNPLKQWNPLLGFSDELNKENHLTKSQKLYSNKTLSMLNKYIDSLGEFSTIIHGDFHAFNILNTNNGIIIIDLELVCYGPIEWDCSWFEIGNCLYDFSEKDLTLFKASYDNYNMTEEMLTLQFFNELIWSLRTKDKNKSNDIIDIMTQRFCI